RMSSALCDRSAGPRPYRQQQDQEQQQEAASSGAGPSGSGSGESSTGYRDITVTLHNVVSCFSTQCHLNLKKIALDGLDVEYKPETYMVTMRLRKPYCVASIRSSGKIFVAGSASELDSRRGARRIARRIQKIGFPCRFSNFRITNVHATCELPFLVRLPGIADELPQMADYEPELHPALNLRFKDIRVLAKVFATGSVVFTGPCTRSIDEAVVRLYPICWRHKSTNKSDIERRDCVASVRGRAAPPARPPASGVGVSVGGSGGATIGRPSAAKRRRLVAANAGVGAASSSSASASTGGSVAGRASAAAKRRRRQQQSDDVFADLNLGEEDRQVLRLLLADGKPAKKRGRTAAAGRAASAGGGSSLLSDLEDNDDFGSMSDSSSSDDL
ncbi:hypothetical protein BOX15_Mlig001775g2, partial [Macrostomum lignano]